MIFAPSREMVYGILEVLEITRSDWAATVPATGEARMVFGDAIALLLNGELTEARRCLRDALPYLLRDVQEGEIADELRPASEEENERLRQQFGGHLPVQGAQYVIGWTGMGKSECWTQIAISRWLLEGVDDHTSLEHAYVDWMRHSAPDIREVIGMDDTAVLAAAAGKYQELLEFLVCSPKFRVPATPKLVRTPRAMGYALARNRLEGRWSAEEMRVAWLAFLRAKIPDLIDGDLAMFAVWLKMAFWDDNPKAPAPEECCMKCYEYMPGVERPAWHR